jgi:hypothetical protein
MLQKDLMCLNDLNIYILWKHGEWFKMNIMKIEYSKHS